MATENRSSNTEQMVSVPWNLAVSLAEDWGISLTKARSKMRALLDQPAAQHQGEPVAWRYRGRGSDKWSLTQESPGSWYMGTADYETESLYTDADTGEVERLRADLEEWKQRSQYNADTAHAVAHERDTLRTQLADMTETARSLTITIHSNLENTELDEACQRDLAALSASAEPAPTPDGFSAGDMADQGAKAFRDGQRALALPERRQWNGLGNAADNLKASGWNACLDEVRRLNEASISPE